jgi:hypothetical protein
LLTEVTLGALSGRAHEGCIRLVSFDFRTLPIDHEGSDDQRKSDHDRDED